MKWVATSFQKWTGYCLHFGPADPNVNQSFWKAKYIKEYLTRNWNLYQGLDVFPLMEKWLQKDISKHSFDTEVMLLTCIAHKKRLFMLTY